MSYDAGVQVADAAGAPRGALDLRLVSGLFFLSGAVALGYEVIWFKRFALLWGSSALAMAVVVGVYLLGLGVGSAVVGRWSDRVRSPLLWYGVFELIVGLLALMVPLEIGELSRFVPSLSGALAESAVLHTLARAAFTALVIGPPCLLLGGTTPLLIRQFGRDVASLDRTLAWLYAVNTLGAAAGCLLVGFAVLPAVGLHVSNLGLVATSVLVGIAASVVGARIAGRSTASHAAPDELPTRVPPSSEQATAQAGRFWTHCMAIAMTGAGSLVLQMIWMRQMAVLVGGSTYAFSASLAVFLGGIALGSLLQHAYFRFRTSPHTVATVSILVLIGSVVAGRFLTPTLSDMAGALVILRGRWAFNVALCVGFAAVLQFIPAVCMGCLFPLIVRDAPHAPGSTGRAVGLLYGWNLLGSVAAALFTMPLLVPSLGLAWSTSGALALYVFALPLLVPLAHRVMALGFFVGLVLLAVPAAVPLSPLLTDFGQYLYGYLPRSERAHVDVLMFREGAHCNVFVTHANFNSLRVNGKVDASDGDDTRTQLGLAYFPRMLRPAAHDVLVIGFGSGMTSGASLVFPETKVTCCEIEPAVLSASPWFHHINHSPELSPDFRAVIDDARSHLQAGSGTYDLIISEPSNPWIAGVSSLFTADFYRTAARRLAAGGAFAQWVQTYGIDPEAYALIARTMLSVFPEVTVVRITDSDTIILGSNTRLIPDAAGIIAAQKLVDSSPEATDDLRTTFQTSDVRRLLLDGLVLSQADVAHLSGGGARPVNTDLNLRLEFDAPLRLFDYDPTQRVNPTAKAILEAATPGWISQLFETWQGGPAQLQSIMDRIDLFATNRCLSAAQSLNDARLSLDPKNGWFLARRITLNPDLSDREFSETLDLLLDASERHAVRAGFALSQEGRYPRAAEIFAALAKRQPESATAWGKLADCLAAAKGREAANAAVQRAFALDPLNGYVINASSAALRTSPAVGAGTGAGESRSRRTPAPAANGN